MADATAPASTARACRAARSTPNGSRSDARALAALVVTAVVVVLLVAYETHPPVPLTRSGAADPPAPPAPHPRARPHPPGPLTAKGPPMTTPFSSIQVQATLLHGRLTDVKTLLDDRRRPAHEALNARAEPILRAEALKAGSADIDSSPARPTERDLASTRCTGRSRRRALTERRVEHVMGMPVVVARRRRRRVDEAFAWLRFVDATVQHLPAPTARSAASTRGALALADAHPLVREVLARCERLRAAHRRLLRRPRGRPARPLGPRQGLGGRPRGRAARRRRALLRQRRRRRGRARRPVADRRAATRAAATASPRSSRSPTPPSRPPAPTSAASTSSTRSRAGRPAARCPSPCSAATSRPPTPTPRRRSRWASAARRGPRGCAAAAR